MNETVVDPKLEAFLGQDLGKNNERVTVAGSEFQIQDDSSEDDDVSNSTRHCIARLICRSDNVEVNSAKLLNILTRLDGMSEKQAKLFLQALRLSETMNMSDDLVNTIIRLATDLTVNPERSDIKEQIKNDKHVKRSVTMMCADLFDLIGSTSGIAIFVLYSILSWYDSSTAPKTHYADTTIPVNGSGSVTNG